MVIGKNTLNYIYLGKAIFSPGLDSLKAGLSTLARPLQPSRSVTPKRVIDQVLAASVDWVIFVTLLATNVDH